jgi:hypothetical protein
MNDDPFEQKLRKLTGHLSRPDPTQEWKADILARALREARPVARNRALPPRWLVACWSVAWLAILALHFTAPSNPDPSPGQTADSRSAPYPATAYGPMTFLALQQQQQLQLDLLK